MRKFLQPASERAVSERPYSMSAAEWTRSLLIAKVVGTHVLRDGQIAGFSAWQFKNGDEATRLLVHYAHWAGIKAERDHRDPDECAESGARAAQERIDYERNRRVSSVQVVPGMIGQVMDTAWAINRMCDTAACEPEVRSRMHEMHGEMIARGCDTPGEVIRTVAAVLGVEPDVPPEGVGMENVIVTKRKTDQAFFEGRET